MAGKFSIIFFLAVLLFFASPGKIHAQAPTEDPELENQVKMGRDIYNLIMSTASDSDSTVPTGAPAPGGSGADPGQNTPGGANAQGAETGIMVYNSIVKECGDHLTVRNRACLDDINPPLDAGALRELNRWLDDVHDNMQCVGFVSAISVASGGSSFRGHHAYQLEARRPAGYDFIPNGADAIMKPGDFVVWGQKTPGANCPKTNDCGHVGYVTVVNGSGSFLIAEANYPGGGKIRQDRTLTKDSPRLVGWLRRN